APDNNDSFKEITGVEHHTITGPHPAGNISVQVYYIDRLHSGEVIWYISPFDTARIGQLLKNGRYPNETIVAITGAPIEKRHYIKTLAGAPMASFLPQNLSDNVHRILSGTILSGTHASLEGFIGFYDHTVTAIPEVLKKRFLGWMDPGFNLPSYGSTFLSSLFKNKKFVQNTDLNGDERAFVATGNYEKVMPMDILPVNLAKAVLIEDVELMEQLGILEVAPEDFALCTYVCPSKIEFGEIIEHGLTLIEKEG
ncbi:MAG TPA: NADH:ubiquinone reductase (Na(+)-transporting) subunit A, partial [Candidatus Marinimicrobia bacterium]|nr:NADH:ubiquinone reductase (Na(+)-transporting) subunit A [Candidatus Neomarinimicrobiota bacterium]